MSRSSARTVFAVLALGLCPPARSQPREVPISPQPLGGGGVVMTRVSASPDLETPPSLPVAPGLLPSPFDAAARPLPSASASQVAAGQVSAPARAQAQVPSSQARGRETASNVREDGFSAAPVPALLSEAAADGNILFDGEAARNKEAVNPVLARPRTSKKGIAGIAAVVGALSLLPPALALHGAGTGPLVAFARSSPTHLSQLKLLGNPFVLSFSPWLLLAAAVVLTAADLGLNVLAHRLSPAAMSGRGPAIRNSWPGAVPGQVLTALMEESFHRGGLFLGGFLLGTLVLGPVPAFALAALGEALYFSLSHGYGGVWSRVFGAMLYSGAFFLSGTLWLPVAAHFLHNMAYVVLSSRGSSEAGPETPQERVERLIVNPRAPGAFVAAQALARGRYFIEGALDAKTGRVLWAGAREGAYDWKPAPGGSSFVLDLEPVDGFGEPPLRVEPGPASLKRLDRRLRVHFGLRAPSFLARLFP